MNALRVRRAFSELRGAIVTVLFFSVILGATELLGRAPQPPVREPDAFALAPEGDDVPRLAPITVTFAKPPAMRAPAELLRVEPATNGTYAWLSSRTLLFQPEFPGLLRGSTYAVHVPARPEAGLVAPVTKQFTVTGKLSVQQVIPGDGDTEVPLNAQVLVQFSRSVAPLTTLAAQRGDRVITFDPPLHGKGEWLNTSIYRFVPTDLIPSTMYRLAIAKGLTSAADGVLQDVFRSAFTTIAPGVATITPEDNSRFAGPWQEVVVTFNQPMDPSAAEGFGVRDAAGGTPVRGRVTWNDDRSVLTFNPTVRMVVQTAYVVTVDKGLRGARGGATTAARTSSFTTVGLPAVERTQPGDGERNAGRYGLSFQFATPMDPESLEGRVGISGFTAADLEGRVFASERYLSVNVSLKPSTTYTATLGPGAMDRYGQVMGGHRFSFTTGELPSSVGLALPGYLPAVTYSATAEPVLYFQTTNQPSVTFTLWPLTGDEGRRSLHDFARNGNFTPSQPPIRTWTETVKGPKDEVLLGATSLSGGGPLAKGYYFVRSGGQFASQFALAVVDTVIVTKLSNDELLAWAVDHDSGEPLAGVTVRATGDISPPEVTTDANGLASFRVSVPRLGANVDRSYLLWIDGGGRHAVISTRWQQGASPFQFGLPGEYYAREWVGHVYTDRPVYRPGETVQYKGIVRADDDAQYSLPPSDPPLQLVITNPRGQQLQREDVKANEFGSFAGSFQVPADAPLGDYSLSIQQKAGTGQFTIAGNSVLIAEFRKPEFQVDVRAGRSSYVDGDAIEVSTTATFFFGGALERAPVEWSALGDPYALRVKGYESYSFSDSDSAKQAVSRNAVRAKGTAATSAGGVATYSIPASLSAAEGAQRFTLSATVTDQNGQGVGAGTTVTVHPAALYAGIRPAQYVATEGRDAKLSVVTVDTDGGVLPNRAVAVKVYDRQWITTKEQTPGGGRIYRSEPRDTLVATIRATTNEKGDASVIFRPTKAGSLRIVAEVTDGSGRVARSATSLWVSGSGFARWQVTNDDTIKLVADKERYEVGDVAEVLVPVPFAGATGLVTVERGKIATRAVQRFATNSERVRIPITDRSLPDVFVSVVLYRPPTKEDPIPRYKVGYVELAVSTATRVLNVSIKPDRDRARPGEKVHYDLAVTDHDGKGTRAELSVAVVDKAVLALADERGPDGLRAFWFERGLSINTASSMSVSVDRYNDVIAEQAKQGKGGSGLLGDRQRQEFRNTAYWSAQLVTKDDGAASVDVTMPDDLTTWRMQVRAVSGSTMVGEATNELVSTKPLLLRPALPRFLRVGDAAELRVLVRNATGTDSEVRVALGAEGVLLTGPLAKSAHVAAGASEILSWPAKVEAEGTVRVAFSGTGTGGLEDSVAIELPALLDVTAETTATGGMVAQQGALEAVYLPTFADQKHGSLSVSVRSALVGSMAEELRHLAPQPHEGAEYVASRLIATIGVGRAEQSAGPPLGGTSPHGGRIASDLAGLIGRQRPDGGWAWCDDPSCTTDPNVTGWVLLAIGEARRDGLTVDGGVTQRAIAYVFGYVNRPTDVLAPADASQKAFLLAALASAGAQGASAAATPAHALFEQSRARLASWGRAYLALGLVDAATANDDPQVRALLDDLAAATIPSANGNHWEDPSGAKGSFMTSAATTSLVALALARVAPDHLLLPQSVRWLVLARAAEGWHTSIDRALGVLALTSYSVKTGELGGDYGYRVSLDDREVLAGLVKPGSAPLAAAKTLPLSTLKPGRTNLLAFTKEVDRPGRLYYALDLRYVTPAKQIEALNRGFAVSREYTSLDDASKPITGAKVGETVRVKVTVLAPFDHNYVVVEDMLPAGLEPVDARLRTTDPALKAKLEVDRANAAQRQGGGYVAPWFRWYYSPWQSVELRDDRTVLRAQHLSKGVYEYVYYARATTPGDFFVAPAHAEETYFPEVFGRSDSVRFTVSP